MNKLSVVVLTRNEEENIGECLTSIKNIADEIIVLDEKSTDKTAEIARKHGAKVYEVEHQSNFHINKKKALNMATGEWILQLDADERVTDKLRNEITRVLEMDKMVLEDYQKNLKDKRLFERHQRLIAEREGKVGVEKGDYMAFYIPRLNLFLGKYLRWGGVYPDGVIRLVKNGYASFPAQSVHEQIAVSGRVGWLNNPLIHTPDRNFQRYLKRNSYYIGLIAADLKKDNTGKNFLQFINYMLVKPVSWFLLTQVRHKGMLDGWQGIVFSFFSALRFPRAYWRYLTNN